MIRAKRERRTSYDLLSRPIRHKVTGVISREVVSGDLIDTVQRDIVSRTIYTKNSDVKESIDPNGNRTYFRYDLASRWLQTQHADGGSGTPLKTTAGTTHSISAVGSTVFYSGTSTYDGNSNLLNLKDENDTTFTWTYDNNDCVLTEAGATAGGNPFEIEGETGLSYTYDGLYRAIYGETHDASYTLTETDSVFNSLGGLERQRQTVRRAHPSDLNYVSKESVASKFDESGRRYQRTNPGDSTRTTWAFDRKHRPTDTYLEYNSGGWGSPALISQYDYLGGGLLHSRQIKYLKQTGGTYDGEVFPIISDFEHDNLLRVTSVRHWRDDALHIGADQYRLLGRYDYGYDENSMMKYEARWHEDDDDGASTTPEETDFYFYDARNQLEKAVYNATLYGSGDTAITLSNVGSAYAVFGDDTDNEGTYSDRIYYTRRRTPTRDAVNWYRGAATRIATTNPASQDDTATGPDQRTNYATSDDAGADPDNPAADGDGSRHNYTVIGQVGHTYDNNRNVLADGTREFRYNYKNQLRHVWRKSDGDDPDTGLISKYREDAFGRRVYAESYWELARRVYLDTRFELDIDMDADNDATIMDYVDGGITSNNAPGPGDTDQRAEWDSFIRRDYSAANESWYFDFLVDVPEAGESEYLGYVSYDIYECRIFEDGYELWNTSGPTLIDSYAASTAGRCNIGIRAGEGAGVWVDGAEIMSGVSLTMSQPVYVGFGTHDLASIPGNQNGLVLLENLNYVKPFHIGEEPGIVSEGEPGVYVFNFDGDEPVTTWMAVPEGPTDAYMKEDRKDAGQADIVYPDESIPVIELPNGRGCTGQVVVPSMSMVSYEEGLVILEDVVPGVSIGIHTDAVGAVNAYTNIEPDPNDIPYPANEWPGYGGPTSSFDNAGLNELNGLMLTPEGGGGVHLDVSTGLEMNTETGEVDDRKTAVNHNPPSPVVTAPPGDEIPEPPPESPLPSFTSHGKKQLTPWARARYQQLRGWLQGFLYSKGWTESDRVATLAKIRAYLDEVKDLLGVDLVGDDWSLVLEIVALCEAHIDQMEEGDSGDSSTTGPITGRNRDPSRETIASGGVREDLDGDGLDDFQERQESISSTEKARSPTRMAQLCFFMDYCFVDDTDNSFALFDPGHVFVGLISEDGTIVTLKGFYPMPGDSVALSEGILYDDDGHHWDRVEVFEIEESLAIKAMNTDKPGAYTIFGAHCDLWARMVAYNAGLTRFLEEPRPPGVGGYGMAGAQGPIGFEIGPGIHYSTAENKSDPAKFMQSLIE